MNPADELQGIRVLLVEDDVDSREVLEAILSDAGIQVVSAGEARHALELLGDSPVDVILSDVGLPDVDGYGFMKAVRNTPSLAHIPAVALTAYAQAEDRRRAREAGFDMHLGKPFDQAELFKVIADLAQLAKTRKS
jgi:CheY-like chemotaxis protein